MTWCGRCFFQGGKRVVRKRERERARERKGERERAKERDQDKLNNSCSRISVKVPWTF